jgi:hypothetical protein
MLGTKLAPRIGSRRKSEDNRERCKLMTKNEEIAAMEAISSYPMFSFTAKRLKVMYQ